MHENDLEVKLYRGRLGLEELYAPWQELVANVSNQCFYHQPEWFHSFLTVYADISESINFFAVYRRSALVAVFPIQFHTRRKIFRIREVSFPLTHQLYMSDCIISDAEEYSRILGVFLDNMTKTFGRRWDIFAARGTLENSHISHCIDNLEKYKCVSNQVQTCSLVHVLPGKDSIEALKPKIRRELIRRSRRLAELGAVEFSVETFPDDVERVFGEFVDLEASGWKAGKGNPRGSVRTPLAIKLNAKKHRFYNKVFTNLAHRGIVELHCLRLDGRLIAARIWLVLNDCAYAVKTAYDEQYDKFSPGMLTFDSAYKHQARKGNIRYINPIYQQQALKGWQATTVWYKNHVCYNNTLMGRFVAKASSISTHLRKILQPLRNVR